jgi:hypothetical protein
MVAVEAFTKWAVLTPLRDKTPESTAFAYLHQVYAYYGGCAELVTDQGGEWEGLFHAQLVRLKVDHRTTSAYHPQSNGMAERVVGVLKQGLRKACAEAADKLQWDWHVPAVMLGYNCSKQASTRLSPFQLMHGITPILPAQLRETFTVCLDPSRAAAADAYWQRAILLHKLGGAVWQNLLIAQHRDTLRYARIKGGDHLPAMLQLEPGMLVYLRALRPTSLSLPAQQTILQVVQVQPSGVVQLLGADGNVIKRRVEQLSPCHLPNVQLTINRQLQYATDDTRCVSCGGVEQEDVMLLCDLCGTAQHTFCLDPPLTQVPDGDWICPTCVAQGLTLADVRRRQRDWEAQQAANQRTERLTPSVKQAAALDGSWLRYQQRGAAGWRGRVNYGKIQFLGVKPNGTPRLLVKYECGEQEELTLRGCNSKHRQLLPMGETPPTAAVVQYREEPAPDLSTEPASTRLQALLQMVHHPPWPVRSRRDRATLQALWPQALTELTAHWAPVIYVAPTVAAWLPAMQQHCWWAKVGLAPRQAHRLASQGLPLVVTIDPGCAVAEMMHLAWCAQAPAVLCVVVKFLRAGQVQQLRDMPGVVVTAVGPGWAVWWWPPWAKLHAVPALCMVHSL